MKVERRFPTALESFCDARLDRDKPPTNHLPCVDELTPLLPKTKLSKDLVTPFSNAVAQKNRVGRRGLTRVVP